MEQQLNINEKRLWELAQQGKNAEAIMKELNITEMATLKNALHNLMKDKGETVNVPGLIGEGALHGEYTDNGKRVPPGMPKGE
ncbi:MAG TPA: hypothetical protein VJ969_01735 [Desulfopila sp.]|nr:hypothetical protein [Desulfopila sp.]